MSSELNIALKENNIVTKEQQAQFLAQCAYETNWGMWLLEIGSVEYFEDKEYGFKYRGAGYIHLTWDYNYLAFSEAMGDPEIYKQGAVYVAANYPWAAAGRFWNNNNFNAIVSNGGSVKDITLIVSASTETATAREGFYDKILDILKK